MTCDDFAVGVFLFFGMKGFCKMEQMAWGLETEIHSGIWWWLEQAGIRQGSFCWEMLEWFFLSKFRLDRVSYCSFLWSSRPKYASFWAESTTDVDFEHCKIGCQYTCITTENAWTCTECLSGIFFDLRMDLWSSMLLHKRSLFVAVATISLFRSVFGRTPHYCGTILTRSLSQPVLPQP